MSLIDDDNNIAVGVHGFALAADDPFSNNDNNQTQLHSDDSQQARNDSNAVGNDQAQNGSAVDNDDNDGNINSNGSIATDGGDVGQGGSQLDNDYNKGNINSAGAVATNGGDYATSGGNADSDGNHSNYNSPGAFAVDGDLAQGEGIADSDGDYSNYHSPNGVAADGAVAQTGGVADSDGDYSNYNSPGAYTVDGDFWDKSGDNRDNDSHDGNNRDFHSLIDFDDGGDMSGNYGAIANQGVQQNLDGGGFMMNVQQNASQYNTNTGTLTDNSSWNNNVDASGGYGGSPYSTGGNGGGFDPQDAKMLADSYEHDDCRPNCHDPCCDSGGNDGNGGGGGQVGDGGAGGAGGNGFVMNFGGSSATNSGGGDGGNASDGSSSGNDSVSSQASPHDFWSSNLTVGADAINQDFSILVGDIG